MNVKIILTLVAVALLGGLHAKANEVKEPKFMKGQKVTYKVPKFYSLVCNGSGKIVRYSEYNGTYTVEDLYQNTECPDLDGIQEKDIQAIK